MRSFRNRVIALVAGLVIFSGAAGRLDAQTDRPSAIPWGAMYAPLKEMKSLGMTGTVAYYRGERGALQLLEDLDIARRGEIKLIVTLGDVNPSLYADQGGRIDLAKVKRELAPFAAIAGKLRPFVEDDTLWAIRFMDEPHDPSGLPRGVSINPEDLGAALAYLKQIFGPVRAGSTSPARYMVNVPNADWCFGQYGHRMAVRRGIQPVAYIEEDAALAKKKGLKYVASLNASTDPVDNKTFFETYLAFASLPNVDFLTSWQWPQAEKYPNSFQKRFSDPGVKSLVARIPQLCRREKK